MNSSIYTNNRNNSLEKCIIEHCAPTLAGMKCASLFSYIHNGRSAAMKELKDVNRLLNPKGVCIGALAWRKESALIYVYRADQLNAVLTTDDVSDLLSQYGYESAKIGPSISRLKSRIADAPCFPHEIGIFLGYPIEDVRGFIADGGVGCEGCGMWKVYCNKDEKEKLFQKFRKCKQVYMKVFCEGRSIIQMTVQG